MMLFQNKYRIESARLKNWDYSSNGYYYITICTYNREWLFGNIVDGKMQLSTIGEIVLQGWNDSFVMRKELFCDKFIVMPNHIHGIVIIRKTDNTHNAETHRRGNVETYGRASLRAKSISSFVAGFKSAMTKRINEFRQTPGVPVWQDRFYDHIIRDEKSLHKTREYVVNNPMNWENDEINQSNGIAENI
jgi:REP element-mobilizing transposase RayT